MIIIVDLALCTGYNLCASWRRTLRGLFFTKKSFLKMRNKVFSFSFPKLCGHGQRYMTGAGACCNPPLSTHHAHNTGIPHGVCGHLGPSQFQPCTISTTYAPMSLTHPRWAGNCSPSGRGQCPWGLGNMPSLMRFK